MQEEEKNKQDASNEMEKECVEDSAVQENSEETLPTLEEQVTQLLEKLISKSKELETLKEQCKQSEERENLLKAQYQRLSAEYENHRKRTLKEKEELKEFSLAECAKAWLPLFDNLERATQNHSFESVQEAIAGVQMIFKQAQGILEKWEIKEISALGETFNPELHTAILHEEDAEKAEQEIVEVFEKGYCYKDKVLRHSIVKVVN